MGSRGQVDAKTDVFSIGSILFTLIMGYNPYREEDGIWKECNFESKVLNSKPKVKELL